MAFGIPMKHRYNSNSEFYLMAQISEQHTRLILETIDENPHITQKDLAAQLGIAVGSVNWYLKRMVKKGYVKVTRMQRRRLRYLLTPQGIAEKSRLTASFLQASLKWYRLTRDTSQQLLQDAIAAGFDTVCIQGDGDLAEIVYLTCLEAGITVLPEINPAYPVFRIVELHTRLKMPDGYHQPVQKG